MEAKAREALRKAMEEALFYQDLPGLAAGIVIGERSPHPLAGFRFEEAVGHKDFSTKEALETGSVFHVASLVKPMVGAVILRLEEAGKLSRRDRVTEHLPWFQTADGRSSEIRVEHLLTHTAGLGDVEDYGWDRPETDEGALRRYVKSPEVRGSSLLWGPEEGRFRYSDRGYEVLGDLIAAVSGLSFEECVRQYIFEPLGMNDSTLLTYERTGGSLDLDLLSRAGLAMPHRKDAGKHIVKEEHYPYNRAHGPSSTLTTTLADLAVWARAHLENQLFSPAQYQEIWAPLALVPNNGEHIGLSWFIREQRGYTLYGHEGRDDGFRASFWLCPALDLHIAVLSNLSEAPVKKINKALFDLLLELGAPSDAPSSSGGE